MFKESAANDDPAGKLWIGRDLIGLAWKMKNTKAETYHPTLHRSLLLYYDSLFLIPIGDIVIDKTRAICMIEMQRMQRLV